MAPVNRKPKGWVLPGFKYLGPFNPIRSGKAKNRVDQAADEECLKAAMDVDGSSE